MKSVIFSLVIFTSFNLFSSEYHRFGNSSIVLLPSLFVACLEGNHIPEKLLTKENAQQRLSDNKCPMHMLFSNTNSIETRIKILEKLVFLTNDPSPESKTKTTPLHIGCSRGNIELVTALLSYDNVALATLEHGTNQPLQNVLDAKIEINKKHAMAKLLLQKAEEKKITLTGIKNKRGDIPLQATLALKLKYPITASQKNKYKKLIDFLLDKTSSEDLNNKNNFGQNCLHILLGQTVKKLPISDIGALLRNMVKKGAKTNIADKQGYFPVNYFHFLTRGRHDVDSLYELGGIQAVLDARLKEEFLLNAL